MTIPATTGSLVGRRDEIRVIDRQLDALQEGRTGCVLVVAGEAGVGKSRLVEALVELAGERPVGVLLGRCVQNGESLLPVAPVVDFLAELVRQLSEQDLERVLGSAREELAGLMPTAAARPEDTETLEAARLVELVQSVIARLAAEAPLVVVIEDLHWADRTTRDLVGFLALALRREPVLLVLTYRSDDLHRRHPLLPVLAELQRATHAERLELQPFDPSTTADFALAITGGELAPAKVAEIHRRSGGNPFYLEELLVGAEPGTAVPMTLREVVLSRALEVDDDALALLRVASVTGAHIDVDLLADVTGLDKAAMNPGLRQLMDAHFLVESDGRFRFRHELTREVFADELLPGERADLHEAVAATLRETAPSRLGEIAYHWDQSGNQPEALRASVEAGHAANHTGATAEALLHFERALELWDRVPPPDRHVRLDHAELLLLAAEAANQVQDFHRCVDLARQACAELCDSDNLTRAQAQCQLMSWLWTAGEPGLHEAASLALELVQAEPPSAQVAQILGRVARAELTRVKFSASSLALTRQRCETALEMAIATGDRSTEASMLDTIALYRAMTYEPGAVELLQKALDLALEIEDDYEVNRAYVNLSETLHFEGRDEEALATAHEGIRYAEDNGYRGVIGAMLVENAARCLESLGRWDELDPLSDDVLAWRPLDLDVPAPTGLSVFERIMVKQGETDRARPLLEHDRDAVLIGYYCGTVSVIIGGLLELDLIEGREPDRQLIETVIELVSASDDRELVDVMLIALRAEADLATAAGYRGDDRSVAAAQQAAGRWLAQVESRLARRPEGSADREFLTSVEQCRAEHSRAHGDHNPEAWAAIATDLEGYQRPWPTAYAKFRTAETALLQAGRQPQQRALAAEHLRAAHAIALGLAAKPLLADIEDLATRARIPLDTYLPDVEPSEPDPVPFALTPRELEVLGLVAAGHSNGQIGKELFISTKTASVHVSNILRKTGAANRIEAAAIATKAGIG